MDAAKLSLSRLKGHNEDTANGLMTQSVMELNLSFQDALPVTELQVSVTVLTWLHQAHKFHKLCWSVIVWSVVCCLRMHKQWEFKLLSCLQRNKQQEFAQKKSTMLLLTIHKFYQWSLICSYKAVFISKQYVDVEKSQSYKEVLAMTWSQSHCCSTQPRCSKKLKSMRKVAPNSKAFFIRSMLPGTRKRKYKRRQVHT